MSVHALAHKSAVADDNAIPQLSWTTTVVVVLVFLAGIDRFRCALVSQGTGVPWACLGRRAYRKRQCPVHARFAQARIPCPHTTTHVHMPVFVRVRVCACPEQAACRGTWSAMRRPRIDWLLTQTHLTGACSPPIAVLPPCHVWVSFAKSTEGGPPPPPCRTHAAHPFSPASGRTARR
jgi:hypothetical protein